MEPAPDLEGRLASVADMADRVAGRLEVSDSERGATVRLLLPLGREGTVAIVDDNPRTLRLFQRYLESYRYRLMLIQDSHEAWRAISEARPDVVVLDVMMRDIDGWQVLQALKAAPETRDIPVIICSVLDEGELAGTIGADGYLRKPVTQSELVQALAQARALRTGAPGR
jgi:CheY-like chemotaxis protein